MLVAGAYKAYMQDLERGVHRGTDVEVAIWAILSNRSDLVQSFDKLFAKYIDDNLEKLHPDLFDKAFLMS